MLSPPGQFAYELSLATDGTRLVAAWHGGSVGNAIWIQPMDARGRPAGTPAQITDGRRDAYEPDIQLADDELLAAWYEKDLASGELVAWLGRFSLQGQARWRLQLSAPGAQGRNTLVRVRGDQAFVAWIESHEETGPALWTARVGLDGGYREPPQHRAMASPDTWNLGGAVDARGVFHVVYDARVGSRAKELQLVSIGPDGTRVQALSGDDGHDSVYPDLVLAADRAALAWTDERDGNAEAYLFVGELSQLDATVGARGMRITDTPGRSIGTYLAWNGERLGLAWCDDSAGQLEVYRQEFDADGATLGPPRRLTRNATQSSIPAIEPWRDGFMLAWNEYLQNGGTAGHPPVVSSTAVTAFVR